MDVEIRRVFPRKMQADMGKVDSPVREPGLKQLLEFNQKEVQRRV